jgi:hypothetical protein
MPLATKVRISRVKTRFSRVADLGQIDLTSENVVLVLTITLYQFLTKPGKFDVSARIRLGDLGLWESRLAERLKEPTLRFGLNSPAIRRRVEGRQEAEIRYANPVVEPRCTRPGYCLSHVPAHVSSF